MPYEYTLSNPADFTDQDIADGVALGNTLSKEVLPDDPDTPVDVAIASHRTVPARFRRYNVRARTDGRELVGAAGAGFDDENDTNPDIMWGGPAVRADHRRNGVGSQLLAHLVGIARAEGKVRMVAHTNHEIEGGEAFAKAIGAEPKQVQHMNHLPIAEVDRALMEQWVAEGPARAEGYELVAIDGPVSEEDMERYIDLVLVMNTMPRDDLQVNDFTLTPEEVRERFERHAAVDIEDWLLVARRVSDGAWAGFHDVQWMPTEPDSVYVGSTGVRPEHRGHALGKWLKAVMTLRIMDERPDVVDIRTGNADSNDAMLGINHAMGYRPLIGHTTWEISVDDAAAWLDKRGIAIPEVPKRV